MVQVQLIIGLILELIGVGMITIPAIKGVDDILIARGLMLGLAKKGKWKGFSIGYLEDSGISEHEKEGVEKSEVDKEICKMRIIQVGLVFVAIGLLFQICDSLC